MIGKKHSLDKLNKVLDLTSLEKNTKVIEIDQDIKISITTLECKEP